MRLILRIKDSRDRTAALISYPKPLLCRFATSTSIRDAVQAFKDVTFQEVHVFRLYLAPFAEPYLQAAPDCRPLCRLDLDDHESRTRQRLAILFDAMDDRANAVIERSEARKYFTMEQHYLPLFDQVYVGSENDRREITGRYGCRNVAVIPNGVRIPPAEPAGPESAPYTFLFVGNLGYYPNEDAVLFFCSEVIPRLRTITAKHFRFMIVGTHPSKRVRALAKAPEVMVTGTVQDPAVYYRDTDAVVIPLRAGGGTRIKLLEAFSHRRPVVSTALGAEGVAIRHGAHLLIADTAEKIASECRRLMETPALGSKLAAQAFEFVRHHHSPERIRELLRADRENPERRSQPAEQG